MLLFFITEFTAVLFSLLVSSRFSSEIKIYLTIWEKKWTGFFFLYRLLGSFLSFTLCKPPLMNFPSPTNSSTVLLSISIFPVNSYLFSKVHLWLSTARPTFELEDAVISFTVPSYLWPQLLVWSNSFCSFLLFLYLKKNSFKQWQKTYRHWKIKKKYVIAEKRARHELFP